MATFFSAESRLYHRSKFHRNPLIFMQPLSMRFMPDFSAFALGPALSAATKFVAEKWGATFPCDAFINQLLAPRAFQEHPAHPLPNAPFAVVAVGGSKA